VRALVCHHLAPDRSGLRLEHQWPDPAPPGPGQLLLAIEAVGLNFPDLLMLSGGYQFRPQLPFIPGTEACGTVIAAGPGSRHQPGDRIIAGAREGLLAERAILADSACRPVPSGLDTAAAAGFTVGALTAWVGLMVRGRLRAGERVLVLGAGGGMGLAAVALAAKEGAEVIAAASSPQRLVMARAAGAHHLLLIDRMHPLLPAQDIDLVFDPVGGPLTAAAVQTLRCGGRLAIIGFAAGAPAAIPWDRVRDQSLELIGVRAGEHGRRDAVAGLDALAAIDARAAALAPQIGLDVPLAQAHRAFAAMADGTLAGKAVIRPTH
jgi:NADPH2:quinone reductase